MTKALAATPAQIRGLAMDLLYSLENVPALWRLLEDASDGKDLPLPRASDAVSDGDWVVLIFDVAGDGLALAGRIVETEAGLRALLEDRDWERLLKFAERIPARASDPNDHKPKLARHDILVVDDDAETCQVTQALLAQAGYLVSLVGSAEAAFDRLRKHGAHLILLDCELPGMSGPEFCQRLRKDRHWARVPVLLMSARSESDLQRDVTDARADDFIIKPFRAPELFARMLSLLARDTAQD